MCIRDSINAEYMGTWFNFGQFQEFIGKETEIEEIRINYLIEDQHLLKQTLIENAQKMNKEAYLYDLVNQNCEHLAFQLVAGRKISTQMKKQLKTQVRILFNSQEQKSLLPLSNELC
eukprot:TRINITY_DN11956_c0_g1_i2.p4 TRINITY_DN11956_c0_g1~~TRINITY_DN11956_c0_g1_i2.p4  ORF type:complete len:117 (+),score=21.05 TRINITY_DN11956_c0_g1_i2:189-539(+)